MVKRVSPFLFLLVVIAICNTACAPQMVCYVESKSEDAPLPNNQVTVNYYFDRTESMKGFTKAMRNNNMTD